MHQTIVRKIFIFFLIFLPLQYALVGVLGHYRISEHWPAFVFPGFKNVFDGEEGISLQTPVIVAILDDATHKNIPVSALLHDLPYSHHRAVMTRRFNPDEINEMDGETKGWLYDRVSSITQQGELVSLEISWKMVIYQLHDGNVETSTHTISRSIIHFNEEI